MRFRHYTWGVLLLTAVMAGNCRKDGKSVESEEQAKLHAGDSLEQWMPRLRESGWDRHVGRELGIWVSVGSQQIIGIQDERVVFAYPCSTASNGTGSQEGSNKTPLGWHMIDERFGEGLPWGAIFKERRYANRNWDPQNPTSEDLILTRIMWLRGLEPGVNAGGSVDSHKRYIYIHGTPEEHLLGKPASKGCIRMANHDVMDVFSVTKSGTKLLITQW